MVGLLKACGFLILSFNARGWAPLAYYRSGDHWGGLIVIFRLLCTDFLQREVSVPYGPSLR